jgi:hypothetical protein
MKYRIAIIAVTLGIAIAVSVWILRSNQQTSLPKDGSDKPSEDTAGGNMLPPQPKPIQGLSVGESSAKGFCKLFRPHYPLPVDEPTVRQRIREARERWSLDSPRHCPDTPINSMEEAFKHLRLYSYVPADFLPHWGVEEDDFYFFSGNRMKDNTLPPTRAFEYGMAIRKTDGKLFHWATPEKYTK